jgi:hypothetical protein
MTEKTKHLIKRSLLPGAGLVGVGFLLANVGLGVLVQRGYRYITRQPMTGSIRIHVVDGARRPIPPTETVLVRVIDGNQKQVVARYVSGGDVLIEGLQFHDNLGDRYTVIAWMRGYEQAGYHPVILERGGQKTVNLMLIPSSRRIDFSRAQWDVLRAQRPALYALLAGGLPEQEARARYEQLLAQRPLVAAHVLNVATALESVSIGAQRNALQFLHELLWDASMQQDRFWGYADPALVSELRQLVQTGAFEYAAGASITHPGSTASFKERSFYEANMQLSFFENDRKVIDGVDCVKFEFDIDYYRDPLAHVLLEVIPNSVSGHLTDPVQVYQLRWIASRQNGKSFDPPYTIERR